MSDESADNHADKIAALRKEFGAELARWRKVRLLSQEELADEIPCTRTYVSKIETAAEPPTKVFATSADEALEAGGALVSRWAAYREASSDRGKPRMPRELVDPASGSLAVASQLVVEHEEAELRFDGQMYHVKMRRKLSNVGERPLSRYFVRIAVDRYPNAPGRSQELHRKRPLDWDELRLAASCEDEPMAREIKHDREAIKELWLLFENSHRKFPLYPGESKWVEYSYSVAADKWGHWFQRAVRQPTTSMTVKLLFPSELEPKVWADEHLSSGTVAPVQSAIQQEDKGDEQLFSWTTSDPELETRFRFAWTFVSDGQPGDPHVAPSARMRQIGIVQEGNPLLAKVCKPFDFPNESDEASDLAKKLVEYVAEVRKAHTFGKGVGLAAPQIGVDRSAAAVAPPGSDPLVLYNPRIIEESVELDEQYEGCLSFFDVRGMVPRPLSIEVEHVLPNGQIRITTFERGIARLWSHEIDHLNGKLYKQRMRPGIEPIPVEQYSAAGRNWNY